MRHLLTVVILFMSFAASAQTGLSDSFVKSEFQSRVKSVDEFVSRFNGVSEFEGATRSDLLMTLFDAYNPLNLTGDSVFFSDVRRFVDRVVKENITLALPSDSIKAYVKVTASSPKMKRRPLMLKLNSESHPRRSGEWGWAVSDITGVSANDFSEQDEVALLSPFSPDNHFQTLPSDLTVDSIAPQLYRSRFSPPDLLTLFLRDLSSGSVRINAVNDMWLEVSSVPGFIFTIREYDRRGSNSGWLISTIRQSDISANPKTD